MKTSILIRNARGITVIGRHSEQSMINHGLSLKGEQKAVRSGKRLPHGFKLYAHSGSAQRHIQTAEIIRESFQGEKEDGIRHEKMISLWSDKKPKVIDEMAEKMGWEKFFGDWIDKKIPEDIIYPAMHVGEEVIKSTVGGTRNILQSTGERPFSLNVTSQGMEVAVLKALGIDFRDIKPKKPRTKNPPKKGGSLQHTEAMLFFHMPDGKIILVFRGRKFEVTKKINEILGKK